MHNFKSLLLLSFVSLFLAEGIPDHLKKKLRQAHTVHDIVDHIHLIYHPEKTNSHIQEKKFPTSNRGEFRISSASMMKARPVSRVQAAEQESLDSHTADHLSLFGSIRQGNDTCKLQSVCVPVPVHNDDPQIVIFPKCYEVMQCVGSCCESYEKCHPHSIRKIQKPIIELLYVGNDRFMLNSTLNITMEEHTSCSCYDCGPNAPQCADGLILGPSCTCECANRSERNNCLGNRFWDEESCACKCGIEKCADSEVLNQAGCECELVKPEVTPSEVTTTSSSSHSREGDIAALPKLRARVLPKN